MSSQDEPANVPVGQRTEQHVVFVNDKDDLPIALGQRVHRLEESGGRLNQQVGDHECTPATSASRSARAG